MDDRGVARHLLGDVLALHPHLVAQRQHDGAHHGDQQDEARRLEVEDEVRIEDAAQRLRVGDVGRRRRPARLHACRVDHPAAHNERQFDEHDEADRGAHGQVVQHALAQFHEVDVEHHDHEEEQHRHRADIDDDEDHRQELRPQQHEEARRVEEAEDEEQHRMHRVPGRDDHHRGGNRDGGEEIEEQCGDHVGSFSGSPRPSRCCARSRVPSGHRWRAASPC